MVSLLVPFVVLIGLGTVAGLVVLSAARLLPPNPSSPRTAAVGREVAIHPRLTPDATDGRAAARAA
ncbi:MAG TPA: hypothetical protein VFR49_06860 [Solirubrobacteraceae bacterium]|nr:hypothetical protein [Solirubrobacteraceae bacterium]